MLMPYSVLDELIIQHAGLQKYHSFIRDMKLEITWHFTMNDGN